MSASDNNTTRFKQSSRTSARACNIDFKKSKENHHEFVFSADIMHFTPAKDRSRPYSLELLITLPANSVTELSIQFNKVFLKWTEHPPDAHHGFYIRYKTDLSYFLRFKVSENMLRNHVTSCLVARKSVRHYEFFRLFGSKGVGYDDLLCDKPSFWQCYC